MDKLSQEHDYSNKLLNVVNLKQGISILNCHHWSPRENSSWQRNVQNICLNHHGKNHVKECSTFITSNYRSEMDGHYFAKFAKLHDEDFFIFSFSSKSGRTQVDLFVITFCNILHFYFRKHLRDMMYEEYQAMWSLNILNI